MRIAKSVLVPAPAERVWAVLLDPVAMTACVPGVESIDVVSPTDYVVGVKVKVGFVSARFRVKTTITEQRAPVFIRSHGAGADATLTSSLKLASELELRDRGNGTTEVATRLEVELLGRLGTFGLNVIKTKADRMWEEFGRNLVRRLTSDTGLP